ncbi:MAG: Antibiotic biosynthesis monooxygenase [Mycobacterium sp.]|nr:Antibiotic biosynthesis monooxygenase [Mycobacterium sp.]
MTTLHIEHPITDLDTWLTAFNRFADARKGAGVRSQRIFQPTDDKSYIYVQLEFDDVTAAESFKGFLETVVWASPDNSPGLDGTPRARILDEVVAG